jgi:hypothetical protein
LSSLLKLHILVECIYTTYRNIVHSHSTAISQASFATSNHQPPQIVLYLHLSILFDLKTPFLERPELRYLQYHLLLT